MSSSFFDYFNLSYFLDKSTTDALLQRWERKVLAIGEIEDEGDLVNALIGNTANRNNNEQNFNVRPANFEFLVESVKDHKFRHRNNNSTSLAVESIREISNKFNLDENQHRAFQVLCCCWTKSMPHGL